MAQQLDLEVAMWHYAARSRVKHLASNLAPL